VNPAPLHLVRGCRYCGADADHATSAHHVLDEAVDIVDAAIVAGNAGKARAWLRVVNRLAREASRT
jgi:hypothetical protein